MTNKDGSGKGQMAAWKVCVQPGINFIRVLAKILTYRLPKSPKNTRKKEVTTKTNPGPRTSRRKARQRRSPLGKSLKSRRQTRMTRNMRMAKRTNRLKVQTLRMTIKKPTVTTKPKKTP